MSDLPQCSKCNNTDKVEPVSSVLAYTFSETPLLDSEAEAINWADKTYYLKRRVLKVKNKRKKEYFRAWSTDPVNDFFIPLPEGKLLPIIRNPKKLPPFLDSIYVFVFQAFLGVLGIVTVRSGAQKKIISVILLGTITFALASFLLIGNIVLIWGTRKVYLKEQANHKNMLPKIKEAEEKWKQLFYCYRDKGVFLTDGQFVPVEEMDKFLFGDDKIAS